MTEERKLLLEVLPLIPTSNTMCNGYKCREFHCISCFGEDSANEAAARNQELCERIAAILAAPAPEPVAIVEQNQSGQFRIVWKNGTDITHYKDVRLFTTPPAQDTRRLALEEAAKVCEAKVIPSYQAGGVAVDSQNYAYKSCAAAIRVLAKQHPEPASPWVKCEDRLPDEGVMVECVIPPMDGNDADRTYDHIEDGVWQHHNDFYENAALCATAGSRIPKEKAPYTHWRELPPLPKEDKQ